MTEVKSPMTPRQRARADGRHQRRLRMKELTYVPPRLEEVRGRLLPPRTRRRTTTMAEVQAEAIVDQLIRRRGVKS